MNLTVQVSVNHTGYLPNQYWNKQERTKRKDQPWRRLATINKIAQKAGYNLPNYSEKRTIEELLKLHGEYSYLTGKKLGTYYLSTLDLDILRAEFPKKMVDYLERSIKKLLDYLGVSYDKTKKGLHVDILTPEPLENQQIYYRGWGKTWNIGSIQSKGKYVVGEDPNKFFIKNGKWYWKTKSNEEVKATLNKFFFYLNNQEKKPIENKQLLPSESLKTVKYQAWDYNLNKQVIREYSLIVEKPIKKQKEPEWKPTKRQSIQAQILSKKPTSLEYMWKVFYRDWKTKTTGYFLVNNYQKSYALPSLDIGSVKNMVLVQGIKHNFLSRIVGYNAIQYNT